MAFKEDEKKSLLEDDDDETIPFSAGSAKANILRYLAVNETRRELGLPFNRSIIQRFSASPKTTTTNRIADKFISRFAAHWELNRKINS
jgi:hypothetical protein